MIISDWSSDVCSSDLRAGGHGDQQAARLGEAGAGAELGGGDALAGAGRPDQHDRALGAEVAQRLEVQRVVERRGEGDHPVVGGMAGGEIEDARSEARRVGKEGGSTLRSWWTP